MTELHESSVILVDVAEVPCVVCGSPIPRRHRHRYCTPACRVEDLRSGPRLFAYADPPYPGNSARLYGDHPDFAGEVDHRLLVERLVDEYPDGWALSTGANNLRELLPLCPGDVRVAAWVKPLFAVRPTASVQYGWEPVLFRGGRPRDREEIFLRDWIATSPPNGQRARHGLIGAKPIEFCFWVFSMLGARDGDELADLFPGSGAVARAWESFVRQPRLIFPKAELQALPL